MAEDDAAACERSSKDRVKGSSGYKGFGSFLSENVEELISQSETSYKPPAVDLPADLGALRQELASAEFGAAFRKHFMVDFDRWTFLNHGAFGAALRHSFDAAGYWREYCERQPLKFLDRELLPLVVLALRRLARFVGSRPEDLVFVPGATIGMNSVIGSFDFPAGKSAYMLSVGYGSVKKMCRQFGRLTEVALPLPIESEDDVVRLVEATLNPAEHALAIFDHVTSNTALVMPVARLVAVCKTKGIPVLIDGAHGPLAHALNVAEMDADYYVGNCHKWLANARGAGFVWVNPRHRGSVRPRVVAQGYGDGFLSEFIWHGNQDYSPWLATMATIDFWEAAGPERCRDYIRRLLAQAVDLLTSAWKTKCPAPVSMFGSMALVPVPHDGARTEADVTKLQDFLHAAHGIEVPIKLVNGRLYVRISAHVYNSIDEYKRLADVVAGLEV